MHRLRPSPDSCEDSCLHVVNEKIRTFIWFVRRLMPLSSLWQDSDLHLTDVNAQVFIHLRRLRPSNNPWEVSDLQLSHEKAQAFNWLMRRLRPSTGPWEISGFKLVNVETQVFFQTMLSLRPLTGPWEGSGLYLAHVKSQTFIWVHEKDQVFTWSIHIIHVKSPSFI